MRVLVLQDFWRLATEERDDPVPGRGEAVVAIAATGICGSDLHGFTGENGRRRPGQVMGHETAGHVEAVGEGVDLVPGAPVTVFPVVGCGHCAACTTGQDQLCATKIVIGVTPEVTAAFADRLVVPAANLVPLPETVPIEYGALVEPLAVGLHAARRGDVRFDDAVLVLGGGPIGQAAALGARRCGAEQVLVSEPDAHRRELVASLGFATVEPGDGLADRVAAVLGRPPDVVLDAVGISATVADAFACTPLGGRVVLVGMGSPQLDVAAYKVSTEERSLIGSFCYSPAEFRETAEYVGANPPELATLVEGRVDLDGAQDAFTGLARGELAASKILVLPGGVTT